MSRRIDGYAAPTIGKLAHLPMKIIKMEVKGPMSYYTLQHPTTQETYTFSRDQLRACKRREIKRIRS